MLDSKIHAISGNLDILAFYTLHDKNNLTYDKYFVI